MGASKQRKAKSKQARAAAEAKALETGADAPPVVNSKAGSQYRHNEPSEKKKLGQIKKKKRVSLARMKAGRRHLAK